MLKIRIYELTVFSSILGKFQTLCFPELNPNYNGTGKLDVAPRTSSPSPGILRKIQIKYIN